MGINGNKKIVKRILAMDLSMNLPAFAVMDVVHGKVLVKEIFYCDNKTAYSKAPHGERLQRIANVMKDIYNKYPDIEAVCREKGFTKFAGVTQTLFKVVGMSEYLTYDMYGLIFDKESEIAPTSVKRLVAGDGKASKAEVEEGVREFLVEEQKKMDFITDDCSDAVAVGISWLIKGGYLV